MLLYETVPGGYDMYRRATVLGAKVESSGKVRVIALASPGAISGPLHPQVELVEVNSAYEAAAELLRDAPAAMVVDLGRVTADHVRLLALAGERHVPVVAFGAVCTDLGGEELATARLVTRQRLGPALAEVLNLPPAGQASASSAEAEAGTPDEKGAKADDGSSAGKGAKTVPGPAGGQPARPPGTLTQAELDALLG